MSSQQQTSSPSRIVEVVVPFREDESFVDRLARANAALGRAIHAQLPAWNVKRNEIAVFGPQRAHRNGSVSYVYRLVEDRKPLFVVHLFQILVAKGDILPRPASVYIRR